MSDTNATYLLNGLDPELINGTILKGNDKDIYTYLEQGKTIIETRGSLRSFNDLQGTGLISKLDLNSVSTNFATRSFYSSDNSVVCTNADGNDGNPTFAISPNTSVQKIKLAYQNGTTKVDLPARSTINFNGSDGITVSTAKTYGQDSYDVAISSIEIGSSKNLSTELTPGSSDTFSFSASVSNLQGTLTYGNAFASVPTTSGILVTNSTGGVEVADPSAYVKSLTVNVDSSAADVFNLTCSPMALGVASPPGSDVSLQLGFKTASASAGNTIGWDAINNKAIWQAISSSGITSVGFQIDGTFNSILSSPTPSTLTSTGAFTFNYNSSLMAPGNIYTPRWNASNNKYVWTSYVESFKFSADESFNNVATFTPTLVTHTETIGMSIVPPSTSGCTILYDGTVYRWLPFSFGSITSIGMTGANRITQTGTTPVTSGNANFVLGIDTAGASLNNRLVAAVDTLGWGQPENYLSQQPYVFAQGYVPIATYDGNFYRATTILMDPQGAPSPLKFRGFACGASRQAGHIACQNQVCLQVGHTFSGGQLSILLWSPGPINTIGQYVQYIVFRIP